MVDCDGIGGSAVVTDCVPSKTLIATAELMTELAGAPELGVSFEDHEGDAAEEVVVDLARVNKRVQRSPRTSRPTSAGAWSARACGCPRAGALAARGRSWSSSPRAAPRPSRPTGSCSRPGRHRARCRRAEPDGERILTWEQVYDLTEPPTQLIVVGSGVTGAEFASAYMALGIEVVLVSSRDRVLPGRTPTPPRSSRTCSPGAAWRCSRKSRMESVRATATRSP